MNAFLHRRLDAWLDIAKWSALGTLIVFAAAPLVDALRAQLLAALS